MEDNKEKIQTLIVTWIIENGQTRFGLIYYHQRSVR